MFQSLRWRIMFAFGVVILLAILLSAILAIWVTTSEFEVLVTEQSYEQAQEIAVFLEVNYNYHGNLDNFDTLLNPTFEYIGTSHPEFEDFSLEFEHEDAYFIDADGNDIPFDETYLFEYPFIVWNEIIADALGLSVRDFHMERVNASIVELAEAHKISTNVLIAKIMDVEAEEVDLEDIEDEEDITFYLADMLFWVDDYVNNSLPYSIEFAELETGGSDFFINALFEDARVLIANIEGEVLFDSQEGELTGEILSADLLEEGVPVRNWEAGETIATIVVAAGQGYYDEDEILFLYDVTIALIASVLISAIIALIAGGIFARQLTAPIIALTKATTHLAQGDHSKHLPVNSKDELGEMSTAFNTLVDALGTQQMLRSRLITDISHELNTPLSVIQLELEALRDEMQTPQEALSHVEQEINFLRSLAKDLSLLAETDQGELSLTFEALDMKLFTQQTVERWQSKAEAANITLQLLPIEPLPIIQADPVRLSQVLGNLIDNALQHTPSGGVVEVSCVYQNHPKLDGKWIITTVRDNGQGINPEDLPHIFERFYRADRSRQRRSGGRGLGLAIVHHIIKRHRGYVWVKSKARQGSSFSYALL